MIKMTKKDIKRDPKGCLKVLMWNRNDPHFKSSVIQYGPFIVNELTPEEARQYVRFTGNSFDILDALLVYRYIYGKIDKKYEKSLAKKEELSKLIKDMTLEPSIQKTISSDKANVIQNIYQKIDQMKDTTESFVTTSAPIVPYSGVVKNPDVIRSVTKDIEIPPIENDVDPIKLTSILSTFITKHGDRLIKSTDSKFPFESFFEYQEGLESTFGTIPDLVTLYYLKSYQMNAKDVPLCHEVTKKIVNGTIMNEDPKNLMLMMESLTYGDKLPINSVMQASKVVDDKINHMLQDQDTPMDALHEYPIEKLRNYITLSRRYRPSPYLASFFLSANKTIDHYVAEIEGIPVAEVKDKYLVLPVVDYANYNQPTLIIMNRKGEIHTEETAYMN